MKHFCSALFLVAGIASAPAQVSLPSGTISVSATPSSSVLPGQLITVSVRMVGYNGAGEIDGFNVVVNYDSGVLAFDPGSFFMGNASGSDQQWLSKTNQDAGGDFFATAVNSGAFGGIVFLAAGDTAFNSPERGTV